jgi:hypothetical protein
MAEEDIKKTLNYFAISWKRITFALANKKNHIMIKELKLTKDHLKLVALLNIEDIDDDAITINKSTILRLQSHLLDDVALVLGLTDKAIEGTKTDSDGAAYPDEIESYMLDTYNYVRENLYWIETLIHQYVMEGVKPGTYQCTDNELIWAKID